MEKIFVQGFKFGEEYKWETSQMRYKPHVARSYIKRKSMKKIKVNK